jgi:siroheme synthase-like protein
MLPVLLNESKVTVVVFGYGNASKIKIQGMVKAGIKCCVISPSVVNEEDVEGLVFIADCYREAYLDKGQMVIAATESLDLNDDITKAARQRGKLVLNLSNGEDSDFHMMSWRRKGPITVGLSTGSCAPSESKRLIDNLMDSLDDDSVDRIAVLGSIRKKIKKLGYNPVKPVINRFALLTVEEMKRLDDLSIEDFANEIEKGIRV